MSFTESLDDIVRANENGVLSTHPSWLRVRLGDIGEILNGFPFRSESFKNEGGFPLLRIRDVVRGYTETFYDGEYEPEYVIRRGDLVVGMDGDFNSALWAGPPALLNQRVCRVSVDEQYYSLRFLAYAIPGYLDAVNARTSAITVKHLSSRTLADIPLPLPPRNEQDRIANFLDRSLSDLQAVVAGLERVQRNLKRYRASVLQAAIEGRLVPTEAELARAEGRDYEPASVLLERILSERRRRWEHAELERLRARGTAPTDDRWKSKYPEPSTPDESVLPELPTGWCWATLPQLGELSRGKSRHRPRNDPRLLGGQYPFIQTGDVKKADGFIETFDATYSEFGLAQSRLWPAGTLCITIAANIAETGILRFAACFPDSVVGLLNLAEPLLVRYTELFIRTARADLARFAPATAQKNINLEVLSEVAIALPPSREQERIVAEVDRLMSVSRAVDSTSRTSILRSNGLRQSILRSAFGGKLVDQDPADEPAAVLLERIREAREAAADAPRPARSRGRRRTRA